MVTSNFGAHPTAVISVQSFAPTTPRKPNSGSTLPISLFLLLPYSSRATCLRRYRPEYFATLADPPA
jgi:hypothetical protein